MRSATSAMVYSSVIRMYLAGELPPIAQRPLLIVHLLRTLRRLSDCKTELARASLPESHDATHIHVGRAPKLPPALCPIPVSSWLSTLHGSGGSDSLPIACWAARLS
jgi:hypothetical protein